MIVKKIIVFITYILIFSAMFYGNMPTNREKPFSEIVEISEYQGVKLGSSEDFRENSIEGVQRIDPFKYSLKVEGLVRSSGEYNLADLADFERHRKVVTLNCVEGWSVTVLWEGIRVSDIIDLSGISDGADTVIFHAYDGYTTSLPLSFLLENQIIIADKMNGAVLREENGFPFQLVAEDKWGYKWIKWITKIEVSDDPEYRGYWESVGYNNNADYGGPQLEKTIPEYVDPYLN